MKIISFAWVRKSEIKPSTESCVFFTNNIPAKWDSDHFVCVPFQQLVARMKMDLLIFFSKSFCPSWIHGICTPVKEPNPNCPQKYYILTLGQNWGGNPISWQYVCNQNAVNERRSWLLTSHKVGVLENICCTTALSWDWARVEPHSSARISSSSCLPTHTFPLLSILGVKYSESAEITWASRVCQLTQWHTLISEGKANRVLFWTADFSCENKKMCYLGLTIGLIHILQV